MMEELHQSGVFRNVAPDTISYTILLENWAEQAGRIPHACNRAENIFHNMKRLGKTENSPVQPTFITYSTLMKAYAKAGEAHKAEELLNEMMDEYLVNNNRNIRPDLVIFNTLLRAISRSGLPDAVDTIKAHMTRMESMATKAVLGHGVSISPDLQSYNSLLHAIARSGRRGAGEECEKLLVDTMMLSSRLLPDIVSYTATIQGYANAGKAEHAERVLRKACEDYYKHDEGTDQHQSMKPTVNIFSAAISAWSKSGSAEAPERAEALLEWMKDLSKAGDLVGPIDTVVYNALLSVYSNSGRKDAGNRAEHILCEMKVESQVSPDTVSYNTAMKALAALGEFNRCKNLFEQMKETPGVKPGVESLCTLLVAFSRSPAVANSNDSVEKVLSKLQELQISSGIKANNACYNVVLSCLANASTEESCRVAEELFLEMERAGIEVTEWTYSTVIEAYANVGLAEEAELQLERFIKWRGKEAENDAPTVRCFNGALKAWARRARFFSAPDAPSRAEALVDRMHQLCLKPDVHSYNILMDCWKESRLPGSAMRAKAILEKMINSGDNEIEPTTTSYNTVVAAFARMGDIENAEALLQLMSTDHHSKDTTVGPNIITWNSFLSACARSRSPGALSKADDALSAMQVSGGKPNIVSFNSYLWCLAHSDTIDSGKRCEAILNELQAKSAAGEEDLQPTSITFGAVISAWLNNSNIDRAQGLLLELCETFTRGEITAKPSAEIFLSVLKALENENAGQGSQERNEIIERMNELYPQFVEEEKLSATT